MYVSSALPAPPSSPRRAALACKPSQAAPDSDTTEPPSPPPPPPPWRCVIPCARKNAPLGLPRRLPATHTHTHNGAVTIIGTQARGKTARRREQRARPAAPIPHAPELRRRLPRSRAVEKWSKITRKPPPAPSEPLSNNGQKLRANRRRLPRSRGQMMVKKKEQTAAGSPGAVR